MINININPRITKIEFCSFAFNNFEVLRERE